MSNKVSCRIKEKPEDFIVEEISRNGTVLEADKNYSPNDLSMEESEGGRFAILVMQKREWNTVQACREIAKRAGRGIKSVGFAGTKDRMAVSTQLCSVYGADPKRIMETHVKDVRVNCAWRGSEEVKMGDLLGNRFTIALKTEESNPVEKLCEVHKLLKGRFPNYYGEQRFGTRKNNVEIGIAILKGDFEGAAMAFLTGTENETNEEAVLARRRLHSERDFKDALRYFPGYLKYELRVIEYLAKYPSDYANALRRIPRQVSLMFVHSVESRIFNTELDMRIRESGTDPHDDDMTCPGDFYGFPDLEGGSGNGDFALGNIVGYDTKELTEREKQIMDGMGITKEDFRVKRMPELNCKGKCRVLFSPYKDFAADAADYGARVRFSLPAGSYATALLGEFAEYGTGLQGE